jgi:hypothetical protein
MTCPNFLCCFNTYSVIELGGMSFSPPPLHRFEFKGTPLSHNSAGIYSVISQLSSSKLLPHELLSELRKIGKPMGIEDNDLGHAYYSHYWVQRKPSVSLKLNTLSNQIRIKEAREVPTVTKPNVAHADSVCDVDYEPDYLMSPDIFAQALRTISPREMKGQYYHHHLICHTDFDAFLKHMNETLKTYFETPAYNVGHDMNELLNGIIKCVCLRVLSRSSYYYAYRGTREVNDVAMKHLLEFYQMTDLIHAWDEVSFLQHAHMIRKYDVLKRFIAKVLDLDSVGPSFMSNHYFTFQQVTRNLDLVLFDNLYGERAFFACESFPTCITVLKRNISADDILYSMQHSHALNPAQIVDNGLTLIQFLVNRIKQDKALALNTTDDLDVAHEVFHMTGIAIQHLNLAPHAHLRTLYEKLHEELVGVISTSMPLSKRKKVLPLHPIRIDSEPFQALIISPRMFRAARNIPLHRASPAPGSVHRASPAPGSVHRASPPPVKLGKRTRESGGARSKKSTNKSKIRKSKTRKSRSKTNPQIKT